MFPTHAQSTDSRESRKRPLDEIASVTAGASGHYDSGLTDGTIRQNPGSDVALTRCSTGDRLRLRELSPGFRAWEIFTKAILQADDYKDKRFTSPDPDQSRYFRWTSGPLQLIVRTRPGARLSWTLIAEALRESRDWFATSKAGSFLGLVTHCEIVEYKGWRPFMTVHLLRSTEKRQKVAAPRLRLPSIKHGEESEGSSGTPFKSTTPDSPPSTMADDDFVRDELPGLLWSGEGLDDDRDFLASF